MKRRSLLASGAAFAISPAFSRARRRRLVLSTGTTSGTFYPIGVGVQNLINTQRSAENRMDLVAISSAGSIENFDRLSRGDADLILTDGLFAHQARNGTGELAGFQSDEPIVSLGALWPSIEHFLVRPGLIRGQGISQLIERDLRINLGHAGSGAIGTGRFLLSSLGFDLEHHPNLHFDDPGMAVKRLVLGGLDLINLPGGVPMPAVRRAFKLSRGTVELVSLTMSEAVQADSGMELWQPVTLRAGAYPGQSDPVQSIAQPTMLLGRASLKGREVRALLDGFYKGGGYLTKVHAAAAGIRWERALHGLQYPLHPAAKSYFADKGVPFPPGV